ncbi:MAG: PilT protein domain protein [Phycisphaerales bacterium]|jgi:predicted nucleic acid-binding protein|nr:PilT protein domain protein [Phycisphaerales bacterium]
MTTPQGMLLDSNVIIYSTQPAHDALRAFIGANSPSVSAVSYVEVLGFHRLTQHERDAFEQFFTAATILPIDQRVIDRAVSLRQLRRISLGDSLIAATALVHDLTLITRNTDDFRWIADLRVQDPLAP